jgi:hypothetical protein
LTRSFYGASQTSPVRKKEYFAVLKNLVKPPLIENPRQTSRLAWRMSYPRSAILNTEAKTESPGLDPGAFSFVWTNLAVTRLE